MATEKVTPMVLKVDLQCPCCYKKIKKTLCKFPQIRDQVYDQNANEVLITVVCCSPEKIRDKLCCKGGKAIKSIKIVERPTPKEPEKKPDKSKEPEKPKAADKPKEPEKPKAADKPKEPEKPKVKPAEPEKPKGGEKPKSDGKGDKPKGDGGAGAPPAEKPKEAQKPEPAKKAEPAAMPPAALQVMGPGPALVQGVPSIFPYGGPSHDGYNSGGPYYHGYGFPPPPPQPLYELGYYGHGQGHAHGYGYGYGGVSHGHVHRNDNYFSEENPQTCTIM